MVPAPPVQGRSWGPRRWRTAGVLVRGPGNEEARPGGSRSPPPAAVLPYPEGMAAAPTLFARRPAGLALRTLHSPLGDLAVVASETGVALLEFQEQDEVERELLRLGLSASTDATRGRDHLDHLESELAEYFNGARTEFTVPLDPHGTPFQLAVWDALRRIPYGATQSYGALAAAIARPKAVRAVGRANGQNRIAILIPCHRCIGAGGALTGYAAGIWRKEHLLDLESRTLF